MFKKKTLTKTRLLFIDEGNDLQSQIAEYFANEMYSNFYEVHSAGHKADCINCELISVMYQLGYDIRDKKAKNVDDESLPKSFDYVIFLEKATYDSMKDNLIWGCPIILFDFGRKNNFDEATDDVELFECFKSLVEKVKDWVGDNFGNPESLRSIIL